jgi:antitoxin MazE
MNNNLNDEEKDILASYESGEWESVKNLEQKKRLFVEYFVENQKKANKEIIFKIDIPFKIAINLLSSIVIEEPVELLVKGGVITIRKHAKVRENWEESFQAMAENGDDELIDALLLSDWDEEEWHW